MKNLFRHLLLVGLIGLWSGAGLAEQSSGTGTPWNKLKPEQRQLLLKAHEDRWNGMSAEQQQRTLKGAERWQKMTPEERKRVEARREKFREMSPEERMQMRERHRERREAFEKLPPKQQQAIRDCKKRKHAGEKVDCHSLWPDGLAPNKGLPNESKD